MDPQAQYRYIQTVYRAEFLQLQKDIEAAYFTLSREFQDRLLKVLKGYTVNGVIPRSNLTEAKAGILPVLSWYQTSIETWLDTNISKSIALAIAGQDAAAMFYLKSLVANKDLPQYIVQSVINGKLPVLVRQQYGSGLDRLLRNQVWEKRWADGFKLSDRIWFRTQEGRKEIHNLIELAVNQGMNSIDFANMLDQYLNFYPGPEWRIERLYPNGPRRGWVRYNCLRVARTETNQAYHRAQNLSAQSSILVKGIQWNLSNSHPKYDICDIYASQNIHGLGPGIYRAGETPVDHPQGLCFLTDLLYMGEELFSRIRAKYGIVA